MYGNEAWAREAAGKLDVEEAVARTDAQPFIPIWSPEVENVVRRQVGLRELPVEASNGAAVPEDEPMEEVSYSSTEQWSRQQVMHDWSHSESEGAWHVHREDAAYHSYPASPDSIPHTHDRPAR
jgi:hypothetical protein